MKLGEYVKQYRLEHGLSQRDFAKLSGLTCGYISMLENNRNPRTGKAISPSVRVYQQVATATGRPFDALLRYVDDQIGLYDGPSISVHCSTDNSTEPPVQSPRKMSSEELKFALWGDTDISDEDLEDVRRYAAFIAERKKK